MRRFCVVLILIALVLAGGKDVLAQPPVMGIFGTATMGLDPAPEGTEVAAYIQGEVVARVNVSQGAYIMTIVQPEGADYQGRTVSFTVGGGPFAPQTTVWQAGVNQPLSLKVPGATKVATALWNITGKYTIIWGYDAQSGRWLKYDPAVPSVSDLHMLREGQGYWIKATQDAVFGYGGNIYNLSEGWNLMGWQG